MISPSWLVKLSQHKFLGDGFFLEGRIKYSNLKISLGITYLVVGLLITASSISADGLGFISLLTSFTYFVPMGLFVIAFIWILSNTEKDEVWRCCFRKWLEEKHGSSNVLEYNRKELELLANEFDRLWIEEDILLTREYFKGRTT